MLHLYHDVSPCQRCGSLNTGYYIKGNLSEFWIMKWALKHGEFVMFRNDSVYNCFCGNCGIEWKGDIPIKIINGKQLAEIKRLKNIETAKANIQQLQQESEKEKKLMDKQLKKEKKRNKLSHKVARKVITFCKNVIPFKKEK